MRRWSTVEVELQYKGIPAYIYQQHPRNSNRREVEEEGGTHKQLDVAACGEVVASRKKIERERRRGSQPSIKPPLD